MTRSPLFLTVLLAAVPASGCKSGALSDVGDLLKAMAPTVRLEKAPLTRVGWDGVDVALHLAVDNPAPVRATIEAFSWHVDLAGARFLDGRQPAGTTLEPQSTFPVVIPVSVDFQRTAAMVADLRERTEIPVTLGGTVQVSTPLGPVTIPLDLSATVPMLHVPKIEILRATVEPPSLAAPRVEAQVVLGLSHRIAETVAFRDVGYALTLADRPLVSGHLDELASVAPGAPVEVAIPFTLDLLQAGTTVVQLLTDGSRARVGFDATLSVATPWGDLPMAFDQESLVPLVRGAVDAASP